MAEAPRAALKEKSRGLLRAQLEKKYERLKDPRQKPTKEERKAARAAKKAAAATVEPVEEDKTPAMSATEAAASPAPAAPAAAATTPADLARIAKEAEGIVTELRAALETESGLLKSLNEKLAALHA